ncbi:MAG: cation transporter [Acidobacteria bacterium]|nr:cation transporter [Acidobacteriota bacterium]
MGEGTGNTGGHAHGHSHAHATSENRGRLRVVLVLTATFLVVEVVAGFLSGSLALLADAGHMLTDVAGLALALVAVSFASRGPTPERTYGFQRAEILAALLNAVVLIGVAGFVLFEAVTRLVKPEPVATGPMLVVAVLGLCVNAAGAFVLHAGAGSSLNMRAAYLEVLADGVASVGVIGAALVVRYTGFLRADPLVSVLIALWVLPRTWKLLQEAVGILLEGVPDGMRMPDVRAAILAVPGVSAVHDLHVWTLTSGVHVLTVHAILEKGACHGDVLEAVRTGVEERFHIHHVTVQLEETGCGARSACA